MLKTTGSIRSAANSKETKGEAGENSVVNNNMIGGGKATNQTNSIIKKSGKNN